jgi:hypothetical protein
MPRDMAADVQVKNRENVKISPVPVLYYAEYMLNSFIILKQENTITIIQNPD